MKWSDLEHTISQADTPDQKTALTSAVGSGYLDRLDFVAAEIALPSQDNLSAFGEVVDELLDTPADEEKRPGQALAQDLHSLFLRDIPYVPDKEDMLPTHRLNHSVMRELVRNPDVQSLREQTVDDPEFALYAALGMRESTKEMVEYVLENEGQDSSPSGAGGQQAGQSPATTAAGGQQAGQSPATAAAGAVAQALAAENQQMEEDAGGFGLSGTGWKELPYQDRRELMASLKSRTSQLMTLLGQLRDTAADRIGVNESKAGEVVDVALGDDLTSLTTEEYINMSLPVLEDLFWVRWADRALHVFKRTDLAPTGRGPVIILGDESGSMSPSDMDWQRALAITMSVRAKREYRSAHYIGYDTKARPMLDLHKPKDFVEFATNRLHGGTNPTEALMNALDKVDRVGKGRADIVVISDGQFSLSDDVVREVRERADRLHTRVVGVTIGSGESWRGMQQICTDLIPLESLTTSGIHKIDDTVK